MTISPLDLLLLLGSLQGFILVPLLWFNQKGKRLTNRLLAWLIGLLALASLAVGVPIFNKWVSLLLDFAPLINTMPIGPLLFFYVKSLLDPTFQLGKSEWRQFYAVVLDWGSKIIGFAFIAGRLLGLVSEAEGPAWGHIMNEYNTYSDIPRWLSMFVYLLLTKQWLDRYPLVSSGAGAERQQPNVRWLHQLVTVFLAFQVIWLVHLVPYIIPETRSALLDRFGWYPIYVPIAVMIYWLGLRGYLQVRNGSPEPATRKASPATIPAETVHAVIEVLTNAMTTDKLYLDPELTVTKVAQHVQLSPKTISFVLNQYQQKSFNTFVNEYRIDALKQRLTQSSSKQLTLTGLAFECGFNSQATFQRTFKQMTGVTPRDYMGRQVVEP